MVLYSTLRRSYSSVVPLAFQVVWSTRTFRRGGGGAGKLFLERSRRSFIPSLHFSTAAAKKKSSDDTLIQIIDSEIKFAQASEVHDCVVDIPDGFPFEIKDKPGERIIVLKREYRDEVIKVEVDMPDTVNEEDGDDKDIDVNHDDESKVEPSIPLATSVSRNGLCLQFGVRAFPDEISIRSVSIKEQESPEDQLAHEGPEFSDLDENLQKAFHKYIEIRGLKPSMANFLIEYMISKDSREYLQWLKKLKKFVQD